MSQVLLTGGTGLLGNALARELIARKRSVRALVRSVERAKGVLPLECELVKGDVTDLASVRRAMDGCRVVYHASGLPEQWLPDRSLFHRVNTQGTQNMIDAAVEQRVEKFVYASTIDVFIMRPGTPFDETQLDPHPKSTHYERSKQEADRLVTAALDRGLKAVFLHPSALYGPGPAGSPGLNHFIRDIIRRKVPMLLPGGLPLVLAADAAVGHVLAEEKAPVGSRYILSESYQPLIEIARQVVEIAGAGQVPPVMPSWAAHTVSTIGEFVSALITTPPLIPKGQLHFLETHALPDASKARRELGWQPESFRQGLQETVVFLKTSDWKL
jgi:dihydroflavonol-4-reductase